jgi:hypothetical protein
MNNYMWQGIISGFVFGLYVFELVRRFRIQRSIRHLETFEQQNIDLRKQLEESQAEKALLKRQVIKLEEMLFQDEGVASLEGDDFAAEQETRAMGRRALTVEQLEECRRANGRVCPRCGEDDRDELTIGDLEFPDEDDVVAFLEDDEDDEDDEDAVVAPTVRAGSVGSPPPPAGHAAPKERRATSECECGNCNETWVLHYRVVLDRVEIKD